MHLRWREIVSLLQPAILSACWLGLPFILFSAFFHWEILDPENVHWLLHDDWGQHALGWHAFQHSPPTGPFNGHRLLAYPTGLSILYTDSNPLLAFIFKPFQHWLPADFQYIGPWLLLCVILHVAFGFLLLRRHACSPWLKLAGATLLSLLPTFYNRMGHDTLMAHWLILAALWVYIDCPRGRRPIAWAILMGLCGLIHPYILFMVGVVWAADVLTDLAAAFQAREWREVRNSALSAAVVFCAPILSLALAGAFSGQSTGEGGFGIYSMGLDAPFNPDWPQASSLIKPHAAGDGQAFEGFQYLGAGVLFLIGAAFVVWRLEQPRLTLSRRVKALRWPAFLLVLLALSNHIQAFGHDLFKFSVPDALAPLVAIIRASGRLFWPVAYLLVLGAIKVLLASRHKWTRWLIPTALAVQIVDLAGFSAFERMRTAEAKAHKTYVLTRDQTWSKIISASKAVDFYPPNVHINDRLFYEIAWRSVSAGVPVTTMYAARQNLHQLAIEDAGRRAFQSGYADPTHLYVLINRCNAPPALRARVRALDGIWIIPPVSAGTVGNPVQPTLYGAGESLSFGWNASGSCLTNDGFEMAAKADSKAIAPHSRMSLDLDTPLRPGHLELGLTGSKRNPGHVLVLINGATAGDLTIDRKAGAYFLPLPSSALGQKHLDINFDFIPAGRQAMARAGFFTIQGMTVIAR